MTTLIRITVTTILGLLLSSCHFGQIQGNGNVQERDLNITDNFTKIDASSGWQVTVVKGSSISVMGEVDENLFEYLDVHVNGNTLKIGTKDGHSIDDAASKQIKVTYVDELEEIEASSASTVRIEGILKGENMLFDASSAGSIHAEVNVRNIDAEASSAATINLSGLAENFTADVSSAGTVRAKDLQCETANAEASSAGTVNISVSKRLTTETSSAGSINYWGSPEVIHDKDGQTGSVNQKNEAP